MNVGQKAVKNYILYTGEDRATTSLQSRVYSKTSHREKARVTHNYSLW